MGMGTFLKRWALYLNFWTCRDHFRRLISVGIAGAGQDNRECSNMKCWTADCKREKGKSLAGENARGNLRQQSQT